MNGTGSIVPVRVVERSTSPEVAEPQDTSEPDVGGVIEAVALLGALVGHALGHIAAVLGVGESTIRGALTAADTGAGG